MSVDLSFYTMFGLKSDYYEDFIDAYNEMYETKHGNTIEVLMDVMCGEYIVFGEVLCRLGTFDDDSTFNIQ